MPHSDPILIVGGGLGGLTAALAQRGHATRVLEGAPEFGAIGYGVQFGPNVFHVFDRFGVFWQGSTVDMKYSISRHEPQNSTTGLPK